MAIVFTDIEQQASNLKQARAVLSLLLETLPKTDGNEDCAWAICLAHSTVHDTIEALEAVVDADLKSRDKGAQAKA